MIHEVAGDILFTRADAIAHGVWPTDDFQEGLRSSLRGKWPVLAEEFRRYVRECHPQPGELWVWNGPDIRICNLFTLENDRYDNAKATLANVEHGLQRLRYELEKGEIKSIALPRLATGQGRLAWSEVLPLIHRCLGDLNTTVIIYSHYQQDLPAIEPGVEANHGMRHSVPMC